MIWRVGQYSPFTYQGGLVLLSVATAGVVAAVACPGSLVGAGPGLAPAALDRRPVLRHLPVALPGDRADVARQFQPRTCPGPRCRSRPASGSPRCPGGSSRSRSAGARWAGLAAELRGPAWPARSSAGAAQLGRGHRRGHGGGAGLRRPERCGAAPARQQHGRRHPGRGLGPAAARGAARAVGHEQARAADRPGGPARGPTAGRAWLRATGPAGAQPGLADDAPGPAASLRTSCQAVTHIGDSTSEGLVSPDYLPNPAKRIAAQYHDVGVRQRPVTTSPGARSVVEVLPGQVNGYDAAQAIYRGGFRGCWVIALGTNDTADVAVGSNVGLMTRIQRMMAAAHGEPVMWVNLRSLLAGGPYSEANMVRLGQHPAAGPAPGTRTCGSSTGRPLAKHQVVHLRRDPLHLGRVRGPGPADRPGPGPGVPEDRPRAPGASSARSSSPQPARPRAGAERTAAARGRFHAAPRSGTWGPAPDPGVPRSRRQTRAVSLRNRQTAPPAKMASQATALTAQAS